MAITNLCWIHLENLKFFLFLGATKAEQEIGQNITINLSLCIPYRKTDDNLDNTVDYGKVYDCLSAKIKSLKRVQLLEYLAEQILLELEVNFNKIHAVKIEIQKGYVPLKDFSGTSRIEVYREFTSS